MKKTRLQNQGVRRIKALIFRFAFLYLSFFILKWALRLISRSFEQAIEGIVVNGIARFVLGLEYRYGNPAYGSGDTTGDYLFLLGMLSLSLLGGLVWSLLERGRDPHPQFSEWLRVGCRLCLAFIMLRYGIVKIFGTQFPFPGFGQLLQPYGDSSPMGLAWSFMGYSPPYNWFAGGLETVGGLLLLHRKTVLLGSLILIPVITNVVMLNFCYDIPAKIFSVHLLLIAIGLLLPDAPRLLRAVMMNRSTSPRIIKPHFSNPRWARTALTFKLALFGWVVFHETGRVFDIREQLGINRPKPPLYGLYRVETFVKNSEARPPLATDAKRWGHIWFETPGRIGVQTMDGRIYGMEVQVDETEQTITVTPLEGQNYRWSYQQPSPDVLLIEGDYRGSRYQLGLKKRDPNEFLLVNRGFHWINEVPFNR